MDTLDGILVFILTAMKLWCHKMQDISLLAEQMSASQEGFRSM
jgi:hypothetical protein